MNGFRTSMLVAGLAVFISVIIGDILGRAFVGQVGEAVAASIFLLLGWLFAVPAAGWLICRCFSRPLSLSRATHFRKMLIDGCFYLVYVVFVGNVMVPPPFAVLESARRTECQRHLKQIGLAMASYSAKFNSYPPAYAVDRRGRPTVSWRVLLLPYLDDPQASDSSSKFG
jgi:hypothetical protein